MKVFSALAVLLLAAGYAAAQLSAFRPAPVLKVVASTDKEKGHIRFVEVVIRYVVVQKEVEVELNGQRVKKIVQEKVPVMETRMVVIDIEKARIITPNGKQVPADEVWKRLKKDSVVALSGDGREPAQAYLRASTPRRSLLSIHPVLP